MGRTRDEIDRDAWLYPVLTAPLAGKGITDSVCPASHVTDAGNFLSDCTKFLIIGTAGWDDDLMGFLDKAVPVGPRVFLDVVDPSGANGVLERFQERIED